MSVGSEQTGPPAHPGPGRPDPVHPGPGLPAGARQREVLLDAMAARPGSGLHVGQLHWRWYGSLDTRRFQAAWQTVYDREAVLRAAFAPYGTRGGPRVVVYPRVVAQPVRHPQGSADWQALLLSERQRDFDLTRPGPLRIALLDEQCGAGGAGGTGGAGGAGGPTRVILTYHQALLDGRSVRLLLRAFARAYLAEGAATGGERRPDLRDHLRWLAGQDLGPARAFWSAAAPPAGSATLPPTGDAGRPRARTGPVRTTVRLDPYEASRLRDWAAVRGVTESTALQAAWALQLRRAVPDAGPVTVAFAMAVSGRGIPLDGASRLPGPLRNPLPMSVDVDPGEPFARLLADLGDRAFDLAAYEWVSMGQVHAWSGREPDEPLTGTLLAFDPPAASGPDPLDEEFAAQGIRVTAPETVDAHSGFALSLTAHHDRDGGLVLTGVHDRTRIADAADAADAVHRTALLLREFPARVRESTTVGEALRLLGPRPQPPLPRPAGGARLVLLRPATRPGAGTVVLVPSPDAPAATPAPAEPGHRRLVALDGPADAADCLAALRPVLARGEPLTLSCPPAAAPLARELAHRITAHAWPTPPITITPPDAP
ncbi:condensation domain-containing protein [Streptomyces sp. NPDC086989]|uniref:condensation domain-containing protein n=1 Tax=Streptomyces sp. NPDC086989 TaxID=3365764 RepID=UPI00381BC60A